MKTLEDTVQAGKIGTVQELKKSAFDLVAVLILIAVAAASLDVFGLLDLNEISFIQFLVSWIPYFLAAILLNLDLYKKGVFVGKNTDKFKLVAGAYSEMANSLSGSQIRDLQPFCIEYNNTARKDMQISILRNEGISYDEFDLVLKTKTKTQLQGMDYNNDQIKAVLKAKRTKVKGISVNILLSSIGAYDPTNIGLSEKEMEFRRTIFSTLKYLLSTFLMSIIAVKDIELWGWSAIILVLFKIVYMFAGCYMSYFKGYDDITMNMINHLTRKTDILKQYLNYNPTQVIEVDEPIGNNS